MPNSPQVEPPVASQRLEAPAHRHLLGDCRTRIDRRLLLCVGARKIKRESDGYRMSVECLLLAPVGWIDQHHKCFPLVRVTSEVLAVPP